MGLFKLFIIYSFFSAMITQVYCTALNNVFIISRKLRRVSSAAVPGPSGVKYSLYPADRLPPASAESFPAASVQTERQKIKTPASH